MTLEQRLEIAALIDRLGEAGETFDRAVARRLIALVPFTSANWSPFSFVMDHQSGEGTLEAQTAGGSGSVTPEPGRSHIEIGQPALFRCGLYKMTHRPGRLDIFHLFAETVEDQSGQAMQLIYRKKTRDPVQILVQREVAVNLLSVRIAVLMFLPWKRPV